MASRPGPPAPRSLRRAPGQPRQQRGRLTSRQARTGPPCPAPRSRPRRRWPQSRSPKTSSVSRPSLPFGAHAAGALAHERRYVPVARADRLDARRARLPGRRAPARRAEAPDAWLDGRAPRRRPVRSPAWAAVRRTRTAAVDEPAEAHRWFIRAGLNDRTSGSPRHRLRTRRLRAPPRWQRRLERAASSSAAQSGLPALSRREVGYVARATVDAAGPLPDIRFPQRASARRVLAAVADRLRCARRTRGEDVREEVELEGYSEREAAYRADRLHATWGDRRDPVPCELMLRGRDLSVTVSGYIRDGSAELHRRVVDAASRESMALGEAAQADLPVLYPELRSLSTPASTPHADLRDEAGTCRSAVRLRAGRPGSALLGNPTSRAGRVARLGCRGAALRRRLEDLGTGRLAVLDPAFQRRSPSAVCAPCATGGRVPPLQARPYLQSHTNLRRARNVLRRDVKDLIAIRSVQACGLLAARGRRVRARWLGSSTGASTRQRRRARRDGSPARSSASRAPVAVMIRSRSSRRAGKAGVRRRSPCRTRRQS